MNKLTAYFFDFKNQPKEIKWFKNAIALFLMYKVCVFINLFNELFSNNKFIFTQVKHVSLFTDTAFYLTNYYSKNIAITLIATVLIFSILELVNKTNMIFRILLWLIIINFNNLLFQTVTAGDFLLNQLLFFNIFLSKKNSSNKRLNQILNASHNAALIGIKTQICIAYLLSGCFKLTDYDWLHGTAIYHVFQIPEYSNFFLSSLPQWFYFIATYLILFYQLSFFVLVWINPLKKYVLTFGILQHLIIAFGMGLFSFGIIMILSYILFLNYDYKSTQHLA